MPPDACSWELDLYFAVNLNLTSSLSTSALLCRKLKIYYFSFSWQSSFIKRVVVAVALKLTFDNFIFHVKAVNRVAEFVLAEHCTADSFCIFSYVTQSKQRCLIHFKLKVALKCFESIKEQRLCSCIDGRQRRFIEEKVTVCGAIQACWGGERGVCWLQER